MMMMTWDSLFLWAVDKWRALNEPQKDDKKTNFSSPPVILIQKELNNHNMKEWLHYIQQLPTPPKKIK